MISRDTIQAFRQSAEKEVVENILPFWLNFTIDRKNGGFIGEVTKDRKPILEASKGGILTSRILWTFSHAYSVIPHPAYLEAARHAYQFLVDCLWDAENSGIYWLVDNQGRSLDTRKHVYAQSFAIYGLAEYYLATHEEPALERAIDLFHKIEKCAHDEKHKGYFESFDRQWLLIEDARLSQDEIYNEKKSMNTHLHLMEAYTNLFRVWADPDLRNRLYELLEVFSDHIIDSNNSHFIMFLDENWVAKSATISFGHDIEGSWLLTETADVLGETSWKARIQSIAVKMAQAVYDQGLNPQGALLNEAGPDGSLINDTIYWWPQAENVVGMLNAFQLTGQERFFKAALRSWKFIETYVVDKTNGEWFERLSPDYQPMPLNLVQFWKGPYHNSRACFEVVHRLNHVKNENDLA